MYLSLSLLGLLLVFVGVGVGLIGHTHRATTIAAAFVYFGSAVASVGVLGSLL